MGTLSLSLMFCGLVLVSWSSTSSATPVHTHLDHVTISTNQNKTHHNSTDTKSTNHSAANGDHHGESHHHVEVIEIRYHHIREPFLFTIVVLVAAISKMGFHYANKLSTIVPESCLLCIIGTAFGGIIYFSGSGGDLRLFFTPDTFFNYLLPPIILESAFSLYDRTFTDNIGSILIFAVFGTIAACTLLGLSLIGLQMTSAMEYIADPVQLLVFSALIVAVDPVAVLAVFNEVGVNRVLYFLVFGESLLNDGVTVVLYNVLQAYNLITKERPLTPEDILLGLVKFVVVCFGGLAVGLIVGTLCSLLTKYTNTTKVIEPVVIFGMAYTAFLVAEMFHFSGIISLIGCGLVQMAYSLPNITKKSQITVKFFSRVLSTTCEIIIFLFLGLMLVRPLIWSTALTLWTVLLITVYRFMVVFSFSSLINRFDRYSVRKIKYDEMFIMSYGGIRGAVCFSLVALLDQEAFPMKDTFITSTLFVIFFTVFIQGATIRPFVTLLRVNLASKTVETSLCEELSTHVHDHVMAGIEEIIGNEGRNSMREWFYHWDEKYVRSILLRDHNLNEEQYEILQCYEKLVMKEHYKNLHMCGAKKLPKSADTLRTVETSAIIQQVRQIRRNSILPPDLIPDENESESESESDDSSVTFSLEPSSSPPDQLREFLETNRQRRPSFRDVFGISKPTGLKIEDRRSARRPSMSGLKIEDRRSTRRPSMSGLKIEERRSARRPSMSIIDDANELTPSSPELLRKFLDKNKQRRPSFMDVYGLSKTTGLNVEDRRTVRRPSVSLIEQWVSKRNTNKRLLSTTFMKNRIINRPKSWSEEDAAIAHIRGDYERAPEPRRRAQTLDIDQANAVRNKRSRLQDLTHTPIMESEETEVESTTLEMGLADVNGPLLQKSRMKSKSSEGISFNTSAVDHRKKSDTDSVFQENKDSNDKKTSDKGRNWFDRAIMTFGAESPVRLDLPVVYLNKDDDDDDDKDKLLSL